MNYYKRIDAEGNTTTVESYSHNRKVNGAIKIIKDEYNTFIDSLPPPPPLELSRDLAAEIDDLKTKVENLEKLKMP